MCNGEQHERVDLVTRDLTGVRFGQLMVVSRYADGGPGSWLCRCDCGGFAYRTAAAIDGKIGASSCCLRCFESAVAARCERRRERLRIVLRRLWAEKGTLWSESASLGLEAKIRSATAAEFGPIAATTAEDINMEKAA